jgi:hypothetical protein
MSSDESPTGATRMSEGIFLESGGKLHLLNERPYEKESILQEALEKYPQVIAGITTTRGEGVPLALVRREAGIPGQTGGGNVWSLDHIYVDATAVPVLVEVKRSSDTRIRREVVGQMLDYAANGVRYWPVDELRRGFEGRCAEDERDPDAWLQESFDVDDVDEYWREVESNLRAGRVRLVFVADALPAELVRIIEFLNEQMSEVEVLGVELRQYVSDGEHRAFVPTVVGRTERAVEAKRPSTGPSWDLESFMQAAAERRTPQEVELVRALLDHVTANGGEFRWGTGATPGMSGWYPVGGSLRPVFNLNLNAAERKAYLSFYVSDLAKRTTNERLEAFLAQLQQVPAFQKPVTDTRSANYEKWPTSYLPDFVSGGSEPIMKSIEALLQDV